MLSTNKIWDLLKLWPMFCCDSHLQLWCQQFSKNLALFWFWWLFSGQPLFVLWRPVHQRIYIWWMLITFIYFKPFWNFILHFRQVQKSDWIDCREDSFAHLHGGVIHTNICQICLWSIELHSSELILIYPTQTSNLSWFGPTFGPASALLF